MRFAVLWHRSHYTQQNSWGRTPYVTTVRDGITASVTPAVSELKNNFVIANGNSQEAFDHDDCSEYFIEHHNFLVYGQHGLKSYFGGSYYCKY